MNDLFSFILLSIPTMILLGLRHALDLDHITAIDNLVRLHNINTNSRFVGAAFSIGHMVSVLAEMILIIYVIGSVTAISTLSFWGAIIGTITLTTIGGINIYSMKKWGKTGSAILSSKILNRTGILGPFFSSLITGIVFGLGFDTATQISAITLSAVASATLGVQVALILSGFFALGMIPVDTLDSIMLRTFFSKISHTRVFKFMSYALGISAISVAFNKAYEIVTESQILPELLGPILAVLIISISFAYGIIESKQWNRKIINKIRPGNNKFFNRDYKNNRN